MFAVEEPRKMGTELASLNEVIFSLHDSMTTLHLLAIFVSHTTMLPAGCGRPRLHLLSLPGCRSCDLAAKSDLHVVTSLSFKYQFPAEVFGTIISRSEASARVMLLRWWYLSFIGGSSLHVILVCVSFYEIFSIQIRGKFNK